MFKKKNRILFAEDDQFIARALKDGLSDAGYTVFNAFDGEEAINILKKEKPDLVLLDIVMPKMDGLAVLKEMSGDKKFKKTPIIVFSNVDVQDEVMKFANLGVVEYLLKANFTMKEVVEKISKHLK